jgi:hypothetical protein
MEKVRRLRKRSFVNCPRAILSSIWSNSGFACECGLQLKKPRSRDLNDITDSLSIQPDYPSRIILHLKMGLSLLYQHPENIGLCYLYLYSIHLTESGNRDPINKARMVLLWVSCTIGVFFVTRSGTFTKQGVHDRITEKPLKMHKSWFDIKSWTWTSKSFIVGMIFGLGQVCSYHTTNQNGTRWWQASLSSVYLILSNLCPGSSSINRVPN